MLELEVAKRAAQPLRGEGGRRVDVQLLLGRAAQVRHRFGEFRQPLGYLRRQSLAGLAQDDLPWLAQEQRLAERLLQELDLVADRGLRHAQFVAGAGEAGMPGGRLEDAERIEREVARHLQG